ncbi:MAG: hypothetical protein GX585_04185 [Clostridiales bacterium]|nr:hypothetical protein [Clostridiales bacterium]
MSKYKKRDKIILFHPADAASLGLDPITGKPAPSPPPAATPEAPVSPPGTPEPEWPPASPGPEVPVPPAASPGPETSAPPVEGQQPSSQDFPRAGDSTPAPSNAPEAEGVERTTP